MPMIIKTCHPGPGDEWLSVDEKELTYLILIAPTREHLRKLEDNHVLSDKQRKIWNCRWAKLAIVGDEPGVRTLAYHAIVALISNAPVSSCLKHKYTETSLPEKFNQCAVHAPIKETMKDVRNKHPMSKSNVCNF